jgi:branched-chain amino acid transport system substrate-binding protein
MKAALLGCLVFLLSEVPVLSAPIKIGYAGPLSGSLALFGIPGLRATEIAAEKYNAAGGINGELISVVAVDDLCSSSQAEVAANALAAENVAAVVGHVCSNATQAALDVYKLEDVISISPASSNAGLTQGGDYPNFLRTISPDDVQAAIQVQYILDELQLTDIAIVHDGGSYSSDLAGFAGDLILQSDYGEVVLNASIIPGIDDYSSIVEDIGTSGAQILIYSGLEPEAAGILNEMRLQNIQIPFLSCDAIKIDAFIANAGVNAEGAYVTSYPDISTNMIARSAAEAHVALYGDAPGPYFYNAYAAAICLIESIDRTDSTNTSLLIDVLKTQSFATPIGTTRFDRDGDVIGLGYAVYQVQSGQFVEVFGLVAAFDGNFDQDADVDGADMARFSSTFGHTDCAGTPLCDGDFDGNGNVDEADLIVFSVYFGR